MSIKSPNIPIKKVILAIADTRNPDILPKGIEYIPTTKIPELPDGVSYHADLQVHHLGGDLILSAPQCFEYYKSNLTKKGFQVIKGTASVGGNYPDDVAYNIARMGNLAFHNTRFTEAYAEEYFSQNNIKLIHTNQGYSKCQIAVIDEKTIITSDKSIHHSAALNGIDSLLIKPGYVDLPGYEYGFFGGCAFLIKPRMLFLTGSIKTHPSKQNIYDFLNKHKVGICEGGKTPPLDIGSVICLA